MDWCAQACKQKFFSLYLCEQIKNVMWQRTDFYCLLPHVPSLFHPWPWRRAFSSTPLPTVLFLSISSRLPPSSFLLFPTPPPPFSLFKHSSWYGAPFSSSFLTAIHSINQVFCGWFWPSVFFAVKDLCWNIFQISVWNLEACCQRKQRGKTKWKRRGSLSESNASFKSKRNRKLHHMKLWLTNLPSWSQ